MKARIIINPTAGRQMLQKNVDKIIDRLLTDKIISNADIIKTQGAGDAYQAARHFKPWEANLLIVVGGDGTVNEIVNGLADGSHATPLAIYPAGTVNDFASALKLPRDVTDFCDMIKQMKTRSVDVGRAGSHHFLNVAAGGMLTDVAYKVPSEAKTVLGKLAYLISGAIDLQSQRFKPVRIQMVSKERTVNEDILLFVVSNSKSVGGFRYLAPKASVSDGLLDVLVIHKQNVFELMPVLMQMMNGDHITNNRITYFQTSHIEIICEESCKIPLDLDGEQGSNLPVTIDVNPKSLTLIVP